MDVLAMTQPQTVSLAPSPDQLRPAARKLLGEGTTQTPYRVPRKDLSMFLSLLLRLRLRKAKWGTRFHLGSFDKSNPGDKELADILVNGLVGDQEEENLTSDQVLRAMDLLVSVDLLCVSEASAPLIFYSQICSYDSTSFGRFYFNH
jgi:hypothetical protein